MFVRKDTDRFFQWRVRNLPYPTENYEISINHADRKVVIRTKNKKYYKRFNIDELDLLGAPLDQGALTWHHANNTLVVSYQKPEEVIKADQKDKVERRKLMNQQDSDAGECKQQ